MSPIRCCETGSYATSTSARSARSAIQTKAPAPHNQMKKSAKLLRNGCSLCSINSRPRRSFKTPPALPHITVPPGCCHIHTYTCSLITVPPGCLSAASPEARSLRRRSCTSWSFRKVRSASWRSSDLLPLSPSSRLHSARRQPNLHRQLVVPRYTAGLCHCGWAVHVGLTPVKGKRNGDGCAMRMGCKPR